MKTKQIGQRVRILGGMAEFVGKLGTIIDIEDRHARQPMYRVRLYEPVEIPGVGPVDLWEGVYLRNVRG
jgi:hypothetical protein